MASTFSGFSIAQPYSAAHSSYGGYGGNSVYTGTEISGQRLITGGERVQSTRKVSSTIINEELLGPPPQDYPTREVPVPGPIQEETKIVTVKEIREVEKKVPKYEYEWVERVVEVPRVEYVDREVERIQYQEVLREVKVPQIIDRPVEVLREVKVPKINYVEKTVEVPGPVVEVPKPYTVENAVHINRYTDKQVPIIVAQTIKPYIVEGQGTYDVDVIEYEPECVPVDVHVIKPVSAQIQAGGVVETMHRVIAVPAAQYNTILQQLNGHLNQAEQQKLPYLLGAGGSAQFLNERVTYTQAQQGIVIQGYTPQAPNVWVANHQHSGAVMTGSATGYANTNLAGGFHGEYSVGGKSYQASFSASGTKQQSTYTTGTVYTQPAATSASIMYGGQQMIAA